MFNLSHLSHQLHFSIAGDVDETKYKLRSVHVVIRHGDRNYLHELPNYAGATLRCKVAKNQLDQVDGLEDYVNLMKISGRRRQKGQVFAGEKVYPNQDYCGMGDLTPFGAIQHLKIGQHIIRAYSKRLGFQGEERHLSEIIVRCTQNRSRTYQSAMAFMTGMFPQLDISQLQMEVAPINTMCLASAPCDCPKLADFLDIQTASYKQSTSNIINTPEVFKAKTHISEILGTTHSYLPRVSRILDTLMVHICHGKYLPGSGNKCVEPWAVKTLFDAMKANGHRHFEGEFIDLARLKMQPMLHEMAQRMQRQVNDRSGIKFMLYSGHDTTIDPLATALGFGNGTWPNYAARIVFELYTRHSDSVHFIRVLYDGEPVTHLLKFCKPVGIEKLCNFDDYFEFLNTGYLKGFTGNSRQEVCNS